MREREVKHFLCIRSTQLNLMEKAKEVEKLLIFYLFSFAPSYQYDLPEDH
jgi:hypothetical protein